MLKFYSKDSDKNRVTIVGQIDNGLLLLAASRCSDKDTFIKQKGEGIAKKRLFNKQLIGIYPVNSATVPRDFVNIAKRVVEQIHIDKKLVRIVYTAPTIV